MMEHLCKQFKFEQLWHGQRRRYAACSPRLWLSATPTVAAVLLMNMVIPAVTNAWGNGFEASTL